MNSVGVCNHNNNKERKLREYHRNMQQFKVKKKSHSGAAELTFSLAYGARNTAYVHSHCKAYEVCFPPDKEKEGF